MDLDTIVGLLRLALITATPIALGAYAGIMSERAGIVNIAIEGMMLTSAMMSQLVAMYINVPIRGVWAIQPIGSLEALPAAIISLILGLIAGLGTGALLGWLHAVVSIRFKADQIISGTVINIMAWGVTGWVFQRWMTDWRKCTDFPRNLSAFADSGFESDSRVRVNFSSDISQLCTRC
jgi:ABC-type uncharacterized transport system permease subunit